MTYVGDGSTIPALAFLSGHTKFTVNLKGNFPGFAPAAWKTYKKSLQSCMDKLALENHALKLEVAQLRTLDSVIANLSREVNRLSNDLAFVTKPDPVYLNSAPTPNLRHIPQQIMPHSNPFECLLDTSTEDPHDQRKEILENNPSPTPPTPVSETMKTQNKQRQPQPHPVHPVTAKSPNLTPPTLHWKKFYIRGVPKQTDIQEVKQMLQNLSITHGGLSEPHLTVSGTSRKYLEIHLEVDDANKLDKALKSDTSLGWFVSVFPPKRPQPVPLMSLKLPPLAANYTNNCPVPLMSLKLPPLPVTYTKQHQVGQNFLEVGRLPLTVH